MSEGEGEDRERKVRGEGGERMLEDLCTCTLYILYIYK